MRMKFGELLDVEDLGNYSARTVINLVILLAGEVNATPDPKRKHLYEIESASTVYYIYVSPFTGKIYLIGAWKKSNHRLPLFDDAVVAAQA